MKNIGLPEDLQKQLIEERRLRMEAEAEILKISEMERLRFSMELHDDICQRLAGISMFCKSFTQRDCLPQSGLTEVCELIDETLMRTRHYAHESFPMELESRNLKEALQALCYTSGRYHSCDCVFSWLAPEQSPFDAAQDLHIYRIVQEALHNALNAGSSQIDVRVQSAEGFFMLEIRGNGEVNSHIVDEHYDSAHMRQFIKSGGLGLRSMRYRANQMGAAFVFQPSGKAGAKVAISIPL